MALWGQERHTAYGTPSDNGVPTSKHPKVKTLGPGVALAPNVVLSVTLALLGSLSKCIPPGGHGSEGFGTALGDLWAAVAQLGPLCPHYAVRCIFAP